MAGNSKTGGGSVVVVLVVAGSSGASLDTTAIVLVVAARVVAARVVGGADVVVATVPASARKSSSTSSVGTASALSFTIHFHTPNAAIGTKITAATLAVIQVRRDVRPRGDDSDMTPKPRARTPRNSVDRVGDATTDCRQTSR
jgi:hypothetical protein